MSVLKNDKSHPDVINYLLNYNLNQRTYFTKIKELNLLKQRTSIL